MATATNLVFGGTTLVNITGVGGFYRQLVRKPNATIFREITLINTAYRTLRTIGLAQTDDSAETRAFDCITETTSWALGDALIDILEAYQQTGTGYTLAFAGPIFNGTPESLTNMVLDSFTIHPPAIRAPVTGSNWRVHFQVKFVRYGA